MSLDLYFEGEPALAEARYFSPTEKKFRIARRGAYFTAGVSPFKWGGTVAALSLAFIRVKQLHISNQPNELILTGFSGTPAATLSKAVYDSLLWIWDLFGVNQNGRSNIFNIFHFANARQRNRLAPVRISYHRHHLDPAKIRIFNAGVELNTTEELELLYSQIQDEYLKLVQPKRASKIRNTQICKLVA